MSKTYMVSQPSREQKLCPNGAVRIHMSVSETGRERGWSIRVNKQADEKEGGQMGQ